MKTYYANMLKEELTAWRFPRFKNRNGVQQIVASMPGDQALGEWELHTLQDMRWKDNQQCPIKYWSRDIIKSMRRLMWQQVYAKHLINAPQRRINTDTPLTRLYTETPLYRNAHGGQAVDNTDKER